MKITVEQKHAKRKQKRKLAGYRREDMQECLRKGRIFWSYVTTWQANNSDDFKIKLTRQEEDCN